MKRPALIIIGLVSAGALALGACGSSHQSAPDPGGSPGTNQRVIQFPYGFRNVAFSCFGTNGVYVTSRSVTTDLPSGMFVVPNDVHCSGK